MKSKALLSALSQNLTDDQLDDLKRKFAANFDRFPQLGDDLDRHLRFLERGRGSVSILIEKYGNEILDRLESNSEVPPTLREILGGMRERITFGVVESGLIHAQTIPCDDGTYLVLVDAGVIQILAEVASMWAGVYSVVSVTGEPGFGPTIPLDVAHRSLRLWFESLRVSEFGGWPSPFLTTRDRSNAASSVVADALRFVVAHELAHVFLYEVLREDPTFLAKSAIPEDVRGDLPQDLPADEVLCDWLAIDMLFGSTEVKDPPRSDDVMLSNIGLLFRCLALQTRYAWVRVPASHPDETLRWFVVRFAAIQRFAIGEQFYSNMRTYFILTDFAHTPRSPTDLEVITSEGVLDELDEGREYHLQCLQLLEDIFHDPIHSYFHHTFQQQFPSTAASEKVFADVFNDVMRATEIDSVAKDGLTTDELVDAATAAAAEHGQPGFGLWFAARIARWLEAGPISPVFTRGDAPPG